MIVHVSRRGFFLIEIAKAGNNRRELFFAHIHDVARRRELPVGTKVSFEIAPATLEHPNRAVQVEVIERGAAPTR